jgi:hypothetical protein
LKPIPADSSALQGRWSYCLWKHTRNVRKQRNITTAQRVHYKLGLTTVTPPRVMSVLMHKRHHTGARASGALPHEVPLQEGKDAFTPLRR